MSRFGIVGPAYRNQSVNADAQTCMNFYVESDESGAGNAPLILLPTPGLQPFATPGGRINRGTFTINGRTFSVVDGTFYEVMMNGSLTNWGTVVNDGLPVTMAASPQQLLLGSGGTAYIFDLMANSLSAIPGATFSGPVGIVGICDDFFIVVVANSKTFYVSAPLDATDWTTNGSALVSVFADNIVSMLVDHREIWFFSDNQSVVYYDSGNIFPFDVIPGAFIELGCGAKSSPVQLDNTVFWIVKDNRGQGWVARGYGYTPQRVSNHAIEFAMQSYSRIDDAISFGYQDQGHQFCVIYFPTPSKTWVYDTLTQMWHERGFWLASIGQFQAAHYQNHTFNWGKHLVGDWSSGTIYQMAIPSEQGAGNWLFATDNGNPIRRVRRAPHISKEQKRQYFSDLQVYLESGLASFGNAASPGYIILEDSSTQLWVVQVLDTGLLTSTKTATGSPQAIYLNDAIESKSFLLGINTIGQLTTTVETFNSAYPTQFPLVSSTGLKQFFLQVLTAGNLQTAAGGLPQVSARGPVMTLRWSKDGGHTWSNGYDRDCGQLGQFKQRVRWTRPVGYARDVVIEISTADAWPPRIVDAYMQVTPGTGA